MAFDREVTLADLAARVGAIEDGEVLVLQEGRAFQRHRTANMDVRSLDVLLGEAEMVEQVEAHVGHLLVGHLQRALQEVGAEGPLVEDELDVEGALERGVDGIDLLGGEALGLQRGRVDARSLVKVAVADGVGLDLGDLAFGIAERAQRFRNGAVDDLEVAAAGKLLELHQGEIRLDAGRVAIHDEADRAGRRDDGCLGVAVAMSFAELQRLVPGGLGMGNEILVRIVGMDQRDRVDRKTFIARGLAVSGAAMVADDAQHVLAVRLEHREGPEFGGHFGRGRIGDTGHDRGQRAGDGAGFVAVIGNARRHQQATDIGVAEAERAVFIGKLGDAARGELRHHHGDFENDGPETDGVLVVSNVDTLRRCVLEGHQVQRGKVAGRVVEEHIFRARIGGADRARGRAGVPVVHRRVEVQARVGRCPGGVGDGFPEVAGL